MKAELNTLDQLGYLSRGRSRHRPRDAAHLYGGPYPFIQTGDVKHAGLYITSYGQSYSEAGLAQSRLWNAGTLCITIAANIADTAILTFDACFPDSVIGFVPDEERADARFIKYLFDALLQKRYQKFTQGAAQENLSQEKLLSLQFPVPSIEVQHRIADVLAAYDTHIENNRRRIQLLEQSARLLYKEWFVHLRFPGHEHVMVVDGVPKGWEKVLLSHMCDDIREAVRPNDIDPKTPYIGLEHIPRRSITLSEWGRAEDVTSNKFRFRQGDILFGKIRPYFHKVGFALTDGITSSDAIVIRPHAFDLYHLVLMLVTSEHFVAVASKTAKEGSKMPRADWNHLKAFAVTVPQKSLREAFHDAIAPIVAQLKTLAFHSRTLSIARDLLLPRLMSGEIEI